MKTDRQACIDITSGMLTVLLDPTFDPWADADTTYVSLWALGDAVRLTMIHVEPSRFMRRPNVEMINGVTRQLRLDILDWPLPRRRMEDLPKDGLEGLEWAFVRRCQAQSFVVGVRKVMWSVSKGVPLDVAILEKDLAAFDRLSQIAYTEEIARIGAGNRVAIPGMWWSPSLP